MSIRIIDIDNSQIDKLNFPQATRQSKVRKVQIEQKLKAALLRPLARRQKLKIVFETNRGFFRVNSRPLSLSSEFATLKGGHTIPLHSIIKVV